MLRLFHPCAKNRLGHNHDVHDKSNVSFLHFPIPLPPLQLFLPSTLFPLHACIEQQLPQRAFQFLSHPTRVCISDDPAILNHPLMPRWEFSDSPPDSSPVLVLPKRRGKVGVWSFKHRCVYISGLGFLWNDSEGGVHLVEAAFFSAGDMDFTAPAEGLHFSCTLAINHWELPATPCACHQKYVQ